MPILIKVPNPRKEAGNRALKLTVMARYSGKGRAECSVHDCHIRHLDCLQIDHMRSDARWNQRKSRGAGIPFY